MSVFYPGLQSLGDKIWTFVRKKKHSNWSAALSSRVLKRHNLPWHMHKQHTNNTHIKVCMWIMQLNTRIQIIDAWRLSELVLFLYREPLPTIFSMLHPLDEIAPVVCKPGGNTCANTVPFCSSLCESWFYCLTLSCVTFRSLWGIACAVCLRRHHDHSVQLLSALSGCFLWYCPGNTHCLDPTQGHIWSERSYTQVHKPKYSLHYPQGAFSTAPGAFFGVAVPGRSSRHAITSDGVRISDISPP